MNKKTFTTLSLAFLAGGVLSTPAIAAEADWLGLTSDITAASNWDSGGVTPYAPTTSDFLNINLNGSQKAVMSAGTFTVGDVRAGNDGGGSSGELEITGGVLRADRGSGDTRIGLSGGTGVVNQSGGEFQVAQDLAVGLAGTGTYNLTGGELDNQRGNFTLGESNGAGTFTISGTSTLFTRSRTQIYNSSSAFNVVGGDATINIGGAASGDGFWVQDAGATLRFAFDGAAISVVNVTGATTGTATFNSGSFLDLYFDSAPTTLGWTTVLTTENGIIDNGLELSALSITDGWDFRVDGNNLQVMIPEPSTYALFMGGLMACLTFVRRRRTTA